MNTCTTIFVAKKKVLEYNGDNKGIKIKIVRTRCTSHQNLSYDKPRAEAGVRGFVEGEVKEGERAFICSNRVAADSSSWDGCDLSLLGEGSVKEGSRAEYDCSRESDLGRNSAVAGGEGSWSRLGSETRLMF